MICQFSFKNFRSYRSETVFDFQAANLPEFEESLITSEKGSPLLPVSVIYGPNGGGKTNLLQAMSCLISIVAKPIHDLEKNRTSVILQQQVSYVPFLFDTVSINEPTEFNLYFRTNGNEYRYYIAVLRNEIVSESLNRRTVGGKKTAVIFDRDGNVVSLGASINKNNVNTDVNPKMPYLSFLAINYNFPTIAEVQIWFESCIIRNYANPEAEHRIMLSDDKNFKVNIIRLLNDMGIDITDYRFEEENHQFFLQRTINDEHFELLFTSESDGTRKLFAALPVLMIALAEGRLVIIDELDAKLHPKLLRYIVSMFANRSINKYGAQLLFTSHDMSTLKNDVFRRDEIWFAASNDKHESEIYSLHEIRKEDNKRINNTAAYDKQYLEGRYGADPYLRSMLDWEAE
jgi:AAA15 family ATPase/GTPase